MLIQFHPYALELFSHVSPAGAPVALCCQRNYVTDCDRAQRQNKPSSSFLDLFFELLLLTSLEEDSRTGAADDSR